MRLGPSFALALLLTGCPPKDDTGTPEDTTPTIVDADGDGYPESEDCDDADPAVHPDAEELCDEVDNDCDGETDEGSGETWYADTDDDGYGDEEATVEACVTPSGYVDNSEDCDDADAAQHPGADELCNGEDDDCDDEIDEDDAVDAATWYADSDGDGYGDAETTSLACSQPTGFVDDATDCDDGDASAYPGADEVCDGVDNDCDGDIDENTTGDASTWYADADADGYGDVEASIAACGQPTGYVTDDTDCDDGDGAVNPAATEACNGYDDDCDGWVDDDDPDVTGTSTWYVDYDGDGYGGSLLSTDACLQPTYYVADATDCDDSDSAVNPAATETCNGIDDDCDGDVDDDDPDVTGTTTWYMDYDRDGYGGSRLSMDACDQPSSYVADATDCDDSDGSAYPGAEEVCDSVDNDCDGDVDEDLDADADGIADCYDSEECDGVDNDGDGDVDEGFDVDTDGVADCYDYEECDGVDNDGDGLVDDDDPDVIGTITWYMDYDGDGYGGSRLSADACDQPISYVADSSDCDDGDASSYPGADEFCDGADNDCDGTTDEDDAIDASIWYADVDSDGYGDLASTDIDCDQPTGHVSDSSDCDDTDASQYPSADESCNGEDDDCDGDVDEGASVDASTWYADADADGYGDAATTQTACDQPTGYVSDSTDCDDDDASQYPGADEHCNGEDDDCDGDVDEGAAADADTWYADSDDDGYGDATTTEAACDQPTGFVSDSTDCDDDDATQYPGADESCNGEDDDCDGDVDEGTTADSTTWYADADGDGYGDSTTTQAACDQPTGYVADSTDCDDADASQYPGADEYCSGEDDDCDGDVDEADAVDATTWYLDNDGDGYGSTLATTTACDVPPGFTDDNSDCDDTTATVYPGASDTWYDGVDSDCAGDDDYDQDGDGDQHDSYGGGDCDDTDPAFSSLVTEAWYDGVDQNCDGHSDYDQDYDGYDSDVYGGTDCDDTDATVYPGADEVDGSVDNDCDGEVEEMPVAVADYDSASTLEHCMALYLDGSASYDPDGTALTYEWTVVSVPSGSAVDDSSFDDAASATPTLYPDVEGDYEFGLTVTDMGDLTDSATLLVTIDLRTSNNAPVADAGSDDTISDTVTCSVSGYTYTCDDCSDYAYALDGSGTYDDDDEQLEYLWTVTSGSATLSDDDVASPTATLAGPTCTYGSTTTETYELELEVTDCYGEVSTDSVTLSYDCTGE